MHGNLHTHPDIPEMLAGLDKIAGHYERSMRLGAGLVTTGLVFIAAGVAVMSAESRRLAKD